MEFVDILRQIWDTSRDGFVGLFQHITSMPISVSTALGFTILVLLAVTAIISRGKTGPSGKTYFIEVILVFLVWGLAWVGSVFGGVSFFVGAASLLATIGTLGAFMLLATIIRPK